MNNSCAPTRRPPRGGVSRLMHGAPASSRPRTLRAMRGASWDRMQRLPGGFRPRCRGVKPLSWATSPSPSGFGDATFHADLDGWLTPHLVQGMSMGEQRAAAPVKERVMEHRRCGEMR